MQSFCFFVVIIGVKHLRGRRAEAAACKPSSGKIAEPRKKNLQAAVWRRFCLYSVVAGRRVVGDAELNLPCEPEYIHQANTYATKRWPA
jgi:hypothetical protein